MGDAARSNGALRENLQEDAAAAAAAQVPDSPSNCKLEHKSDHRLQTLTLESMLRHMEEIQVRASPREGRRQIERAPWSLFLVGSSPAVFTDAVSFFFLSLCLFF